MEVAVGDKCPTTINAVERENKDCKCNNPDNLKLATMVAYKLGC